MQKTNSIETVAQDIGQVSQTPESTKGLWTARIAASYCGFQSPVTVLRAFRDGKLPGYKLNSRTVRFDPSEVKAWIAAGRVGGNGGA